MLLWKTEASPASLQEKAQFTGCLESHFSPANKVRGGCPSLCNIRPFSFSRVPSVHPSLAPGAAHLCTAVAMASQSVFVVAIDFGTSYSGYCFSLASGTDQIRQVYWGTEHGLKTPKTPTCILFNQKQEFKYFGYDAVMKYKSLPSSQADSWYFFQNFKMHLHNTVGGSYC